MKKNTIPTTIFILQILGIFYLLFQYNFGNSHIPVAFILLNFFAIFSGFILVLSWFLYFKTKEKLIIWKLIIGISVATILALIGIYIGIGFDKY